MWGMFGGTKEEDTNASAQPAAENGGDMFGSVSVCPMKRLHLLLSILGVCFSGLSLAPNAGDDNSSVSLF